MRDMTQDPKRPQKDPFELALRAVSRRERTEAELREWLAARGCEPEGIDAAVGELLSTGTVDDARYARLFAEDKREFSGWGSARIRAALAERGVAREVIDRTVAADGGYDDEVGRASSLLVRRGESLDDDASRARALGFLARRGYELEVAYEAVRGFDRAA